MTYFFDILGEDKDDILLYCLGENWSNLPLTDIHVYFNEKLGTKNDSILDSVNIIKSAWTSHKRDLNLKEILE